MKEVGGIGVGAVVVVIVVAVVAQPKRGWAVVGW